MNTNLFKKVSKIILVVVFVTYLFIGNFTFAAAPIVPMNWDLNQIRKEVTRRENIYDNYYFNGRDPNSTFMRRQEATISAFKARQYDLEFQQTMGYPNPYNAFNPEDYSLDKYVSDGKPTPNVNYDPNQNITNPANGANNLTEGLTETGSDTPTSDWASKIQHQGDPWGGLVVGRVECTCEPPNYIVFINDYVINSTRTLKVDFAYTGFYLFYDLKPGQYGLGTFDKDAICKIRMGNNCVNYKVDGVINRGPGFGSSGIMLPGMDSSSLPTGPTDSMGNIPSMLTF